MKKIRAMPTAKLAGAPGDVYACSPDDHAGDEKSIITILSAPVAD